MVKIHSLGCLSSELLQLTEDIYELLMSGDDDKKKKIKELIKFLGASIVRSLCYSMNETNNHSSVASLSVHVNGVVKDNDLSNFSDSVLKNVNEKLKQSGCCKRLAAKVNDPTVSEELILYDLSDSNVIKFVYRRSRKHECVLSKAPSIRSHSINSPTRSVDSWYEKFAICDYDWNHVCDDGNDISIKYLSRCPLPLSQETDVVEYKEAYDIKTATQYAGKLLRSGHKSVIIFGIKDQTLTQSGCIVDDEIINYDIKEVLSRYIKGYFPPISLGWVSVDVWDVDGTSEDDINKRCIAFKFNLPSDYPYFGLNIGAPDVDFLSPQLFPIATPDSVKNGPPVDVYFKLRTHVKVGTEDLLVNNQYAKLLINFTAECSLSVIEDVLPFVHFDAVCCDKGKVNDLTAVANATAFFHSPLVLVWCVDSSEYLGFLSEIICSWRNQELISSMSSIKVVVLTNTGGAPLWQQLKNIQSIENVSIVDVISTIFPPTWRAEYPTVPIVRGGTLIGSHSSTNCHDNDLSQRQSYLEKRPDAITNTGRSLLDLVSRRVPFMFDQTTNFAREIWQNVSSSTITEARPFLHFTICSKQACIGASTALLQIGLFLSNCDSMNVCVCVADSDGIVVSNCEDKIIIVLCDAGITFDYQLFGNGTTKYKRLVVISVKNTEGKEHTLHLDPFLRSKDEAARFVNYLKTCYTENDSGDALDALLLRFDDQTNGNGNMYDRHRFAFVVTAANKLTEPFSHWIRKEYSQDFSKDDQSTLRKIAFLQFYTKHYDNYLQYIDSSRLSVKRGGLLMLADASTSRFTANGAENRVRVVFWDPLIAECLCNDELFETWNSILIVFTRALAPSKYALFLHDTLIDCDHPFSRLVHRIIVCMHQMMMMPDYELEIYVDSWLGQTKLYLDSLHHSETLVHVLVLKSRMYRKLGCKNLCYDCCNMAYMCTGTKSKAYPLCPLALSNYAFNCSYYKDYKLAHTYYMKLLRLAKSEENYKNAYVNAHRLPKSVRLNAVNAVNMFKPCDSTGSKHGAENMI